jgi:transmembrane protein EpsG
MIVNFTVLFLILFIGHLCSRGNKDYTNSDVNRKKYIKIIAVILILQSGLRNVAVGSDTYAYYTYFEEIKTTSWEAVFQNFITVYQLGEGKDAGYLLFEKITQLFTSEYQVFLLLIATLFFTALGNFIYKNTTRLSDAIMAFIIYSVLFYSFFSITGHRQTIATALILFSFEFIKKKRIIPFLLLIFIAFFLHKSSIIYIPFYFICRIKQPKKLFIGVLLLFPIFMVNRNMLAQSFQSLAGYEEYEQFEGAGTLTFSIMFLLICIVALFRQKIIFYKNSNSQYYYNAFAIALLFLPLTWINPSMMRVVQYFSIFMLLFVPAIIRSFEAFSSDSYKRINTLVIIVLILLFIKANWNAPPYGFFWNEMRLEKEYYIN